MTARPISRRWPTVCNSKSTISSRCRDAATAALRELAEGDIRLTPAGKRFAEMDVDQRKKLFGDHLLFYVPLAQRIRRVLDERPSHHAPATRFREELEDYMSEDYAETTLKSVTTWAATARFSPMMKARNRSTWRIRNS